MRRIKVELSEHPSGAWGWRVTVHSDIPGDLLVRACVLGRNRGTNFLDPNDSEDIVVESAMYSATHAISDLYDDIVNHPALYGPDVLGSGVPDDSSIWDDPTVRYAIQRGFIIAGNDGPDALKNQNPPF